MYSHRSTNFNVGAAGDRALEALVVSRLITKDDKVSFDYSGAFCTNSFKISHAVMLDSIGFYGPQEDTSAIYSAFIDIFASPNPLVDRKAKRIQRINCNVLGRKGEIFYIKVAPQLRMNPGSWYHVQFMLDGPKMGVMKKWEEIVAVPVPNLDDKVTFVFMRGSGQMPELKFNLA